MRESPFGRRSSSVRAYASAAAFAAHPESRHVNYITDVFNEENGLPTGEANAILQARNSCRFPYF